VLGRWRRADGGEALAAIDRCIAAQPKQGMTMTDTELDAVYTRLCKTMTQLGEPPRRAVLARFALLAIDRIGDADSPPSGSSTPPRRPAAPAAHA
jgi:hypothetical protein